MNLSALVGMAKLPTSNKLLKDVGEEHQHRQKMILTTAVVRVDELVDTGVDDTFDTSCIANCGNGKTVCCSCEGVRQLNMKDVMMIHIHHRIMGSVVSIIF